MPGEDSRRSRLSGVSPLARASKRSKIGDIEKIFKEADSDGDGLLSLVELRSYLGDYLGYGDAEITSFFQKHADAGRGGVDITGLQQGYADLNPYTISNRRNELVVRKPGAVCAPGAQMQLEELEGSTVLVCDRSDQVFVDVCKDCKVLIGPCDSSTFVRDCSNSVFWIATRQLRTRDCHNCLFFLYTFTEPIIESSTALAFAPFTASYPGLSKHFEEAKLDPERNFWSALFDFTGKAGSANWRILPLDECQELSVEFPSEGNNSWDCPTPRITHELLCGASPKSEETGQSVASIPQTRPHHPAVPSAGAVPQRLVVSDAEGATIKPAAANVSSLTEVRSAPKPRKLRKPKWITIDRIKPESKGVNLFAKVVKAVAVEGKEDMSEVVIGDATALITLRARGEQLGACSPGNIIRIQNARVAMFKGFVRLEVTKWGVLKPALTDHPDIEPRLSNDISAVEYALN